MLLAPMADRLSRSIPLFCSNLTTNSSILPLPNNPITKVRCVGRQISLPANCLSNCPNDAVGPRVFVTSDLHTDYPDNMEWVRSLSTDWYRKDVLIVAGDVAETYENFKLTMAELKERFRSVFFVPGNHDLWCRNEGEEFNTVIGEKYGMSWAAGDEFWVSSAQSEVGGGLGSSRLFSIFV